MEEGLKIQKNSSDQGLEDCMAGHASCQTEDCPPRRTGNHTAARRSENDAEDDCLASLFGLKEQAWEQYSPLTLAYIGDSVYDLIIRTVLVKQANCQTAKLHQRASNLVKATAQAKIIAALLPHLTEEEQSIYRRGHNAKPQNVAKNASRREYLEATGFEAVIGYLYLKKEYQRMLELVKLGLEESNHAL